MNLDRIIELFMRKNGYLNNRNIKGIILYGSAAKEFNNDLESIDILVIKENGKDFKGLSYVGVTKVQYFERSFSSLVNEIENIDINSDRTLYSILKTGKVIENKNETIDDLKKEIEGKLDVEPKRKIMYNRLNKISQLLVSFNENKDNILGKYIYYNLIDEIRKYYHERNGFSEIPSHKVKVLYTNESEAESYCLLLPPMDFRNLYLRLLNNYNEDDFNKFLEETLTNNLAGVFDTRTKVDYGEDYIKYEVTVIEDIFNKCINSCSDRDEDFLSIYYLMVERLRELYVSLNKIDNFPCDLNVLDTRLFYKIKAAIEEPNIKNLHILFLQIIGSLKINLKNYKVKC